MFNSIGVGEIIVIAVLALIVMGPEKFPEFAKIAMRAFRDVRGYVDDIKKEMGNELRPVKKEIAQLARYNPEEYAEKMATAFSSALDDEPDKTSKTDSVESTASADPAGSAEPAESAESGEKPEEVSPAQDAAEVSETSEEACRYED